MKKVLLTLVIISLLSCKTVIDLKVREGGIFPVCLFIDDIPSKKLKPFEEEVIFWNRKMKEKVFKISPFCNDSDDLVPVAFVNTLPRRCGYYGCIMITRHNRKIIFRQVFIQNKAKRETIRHELGHLLGCRHEDVAPPCDFL